MLTRPMGPATKNAVPLDLIIDIFDDVLQRCRGIIVRDFRAFQFMNFLAEFVYFSGDRCKCLGKRIVNLLWISDHNTLALAKDDVTRNAYDCRIIGDIS